MGGIIIFECYTGFAYKDLAALRKENIEIGIDGHKWIVIRRGKTGVTCRIPLFPISENIIKKYAAHSEVIITGKLLPVPSNQKMNAYLKEVAAIVGKSEGIEGICTWSRKITPVADSFDVTAFKTAKPKLYEKYCTKVKNAIFSFEVEKFRAYKPR